MRLSRIYLHSGSDVTDPLLTLPTGTKTGSSTADGTVVSKTTTAQTGAGTLYYLASTSATATRSDVIAGDSQAVTSDGQQSVSWTGLSASTEYYPHYLFLDKQGRYSNVATGTSFTTDSGGGGGDHDLLADDVESASEVTSPSVGQEHALLADDTESASEVTSPTVGQVHALLADDVESASEVSSPTLAEADHELLADDVESASEVSSPAVGQVHALLADDVESASEVSSPEVGQEHGLLADDVESASEVSSPTAAIAGPATSVTVYGITGGGDLSSLSYCVFDGADIGTASIIKQANDEETNASGDLTIDITGLGATEGEVLTIVITNYTTTPSDSDRGAVCYGTAA